MRPLPIANPGGNPLGLRSHHAAAIAAATTTAAANWIAKRLLGDTFFAVVPRTGEATARSLLGNCDVGLFGEVTSAIMIAFFRDESASLGNANSLVALAAD